VIALVMGTLVLYLPVIHSDFVNWDDPLYVTGNLYVQSGLNASSLHLAFTDMHISWMPLTWLSLMLDAQLYGLKPSMFHLTNLWLHIINTLLVFMILNSATNATGRSGVVAALFAWHPLHVESVAWISERKGLLSAAFCLGSLLCYVRYCRQPSLARYLWSFLLFIFAIMSKPSAVVFPIMLFLFDIWPCSRVARRETGPACDFIRIGVLRRELQTKMSIWWLVLEKVPFLMIAVLFSIVTYFTQEAGGAMDNAIANLPLTSRVLNAFVAYARYLQKTFWPIGLSFFYPHPKDWSDLVVSISISVILVLSCLVLAFARRTPFLMFGWLWFVLTLLPVIGIVQVGYQSMADRYTYIPLIGVFVSLVWSVDLLFRKMAKLRPLYFVGTVVALVSCAALSFAQIRVWRHPVTLYTHALALDKNNFVAHRNLGGFLINHGAMEQGVEHLKEAVRLYPGIPDFLYDLGFSLIECGQINPGVATIDAGLAVDLNTESRTVARGKMAEIQGNIERTVSLYRNVLWADPDNIEALWSISWILSTHADAKIRDGEKALLFSRHLCELTAFRNPRFLMSLAAAQAECNRFDQALKTLQRASSLLSLRADAWAANNLPSISGMITRGYPVRITRTLAIESKE